MHFYNDNDPHACRWLRELIDAGQLPAGVIDQHSITALDPHELSRYTQVHLFAGIGGWPLALKLAGWPDDVPVWSGSCPCQPFSCAGRGKGTADSRHLWPDMLRLIEECKPPVVFGEQVASAAALTWLSRIRADLEEIGYAIGASDLPAASVGAPHIRQRLYWGAYSTEHGQEGLFGELAAQVSTHGASQALGPWHGTGSPFEQWPQLLAESHVCRVANGVSSMLDIRPRLHAYGNAIVPQLAAEFIAAFVETLQPTINS